MATVSSGLTVLALSYSSNTGGREKRKKEQDKGLKGKHFRQLQWAKDP